MASLPSNVAAIEAGLQFSTGQQPFVSLVGPSGWGKSHLLEAVACRIGHDTGCAPTVFSAVEWVVSGVRADSPGALLLDNVQDALEGSRNRTLLKMALERRVRGGMATILSFTAAKKSRQLKSFLPEPRLWTIVSMPTPDPTERALVVSQMSVAEGLTLSPTLTRLLATKMKGNGRTLSGALKRLRLYGAQWLDDRSVLRACGVLDPFFADNSGWDLRDRVLKTAEQPEFRSMGDVAHTLALYTMLREASLSEASVARCFDVRPAEAYSRAVRFDEKIRTCEVTRDCARRFVERVVEGLATE